MSFKMKRSADISYGRYPAAAIMTRNMHSGFCNLFLPTKLL